MKIEDKYNEATINPEIEADGFITRAETLERINQDRAKPMSECVYPHCEECDKYHGKHCTVPVVFTKQMYMMMKDWSAKTTEKQWALEAEIDWLKEVLAGGERHTKG